MKEPEINQPTREEQREYTSLRDNDYTEVNILGTNRKYRIRWLINAQICKLSRVLLRKNNDDAKDKSEGNVLNQIIDDSKIACKTSAIYILDGYWKLTFLYWFLWRWFYYVKQYSAEQLQPIIDEGKKKVPLMQFLQLTTSLIGAKATLMQMRTEEAERILQELSTEQHSQQPSTSNG